MKDEKFEDEAMPKHFHNMLKRELLCNYRNDGLMVFLAIEKKKKPNKIIAEKRPLAFNDILLRVKYKWSLI